MRSMLFNILVLVLSLSLFVVGCKSESGDAEGGSGGGAAPSEPSEPEWPQVTLEQLNGVKIRLPEGVEPSEMGSELMMMSMDVSFLLGEAGDSAPATLEDAKAKANAQEGVGNLKEETLEDGWALTYTTGEGENTTWWVEVRRELGGKAYRCHTSIGFEMQATGTLRACKSLSL